jgi:uncharacterized membrane protein (UPF0127 family)
VNRPAENHSNGHVPALSSGAGQEPNESSMSKLVLVAPGGRVVCDTCHLADKPQTRLRGIMGWKSMRRGEGMLIRPTFSIHTMFVRFPIDAVFLDKEMKVVSIAHDLKPWRFAGARKAKSVLELAAGECRRLGLERGDHLGWARR